MNTLTCRTFTGFFEVHFWLEHKQFGLYF